jgi:uncharacterized protein involved in outer membrane biogenesis
MVNLIELIRRPRIRWALRVVVALLVLWAIVGFFVLPGILRPIIERKLAENLHRTVTLKHLSLNPFALSATLEGVDVKDKGGGPFFSFESLYVNAQATSIFRGGPVLRAVTLTKPSIAVVRNEDGTYNFQDILDEALKPSPKPEKEKPLRFSLNNIRVEGGSVDFDDRPQKTKHTIRDIRVGIPFLSNIPSKVEITTQPMLEAKVNGAPFALKGETKPLSPTRETTLNFDLSDVDLPFYLAYAPVVLESELKSGRLDAKLKASFHQPPKGEPALILSGGWTIRKLTLNIGGRPVVACDRLETVLSSVDVFGRKVRVQSIKVTAPEVWARHEKSGEYNVQQAFPGTRVKKVRAAEGHPWRLSVAEIGVERGTVHYDDLSLGKPFSALVTDIGVSVLSFSTFPGQKGTFDVSAKTDAGEAFKNTGSFTVEPLAVDGALDIKGLPLKRYTPFFDNMVKLEVDDGVVDLATKYHYAAGEKPEESIADLSATLKSPRLRKRGEKDPFFRAPSVQASVTSLDMNKRDVAVGQVTSSGGYLAVVRDKNGNADLTQLMVEAGPSSDAPPAAPDPPSAPSSPWAVSLDKLAIDGYTIKMTDQAAPAHTANFAMTKTNLSLENFSTAAGKRGNLTFQFGINGKGLASVKGPVGVNPTYAELQTEVKNLDLVPLEPYVISDFKLTLAKGTVSATGTLSMRQDAQGKPGFVFAGKAGIANLLTLDPSGVDFFKWDSFALDGLKAGYNPTFLELSRLSISGVQCDVVIESDGSINMMKVMGKNAPAKGGEKSKEEAAASSPPPAEAPPPPAATAQTAAAPAAETSPGPAAAASAPATASVSASASEKIPIRIDTLILKNGKIGLADHFVKPNYRGTLGNLEGKLTGLSTDQNTVARLDLHGSLANHSPLEVSGKVNPLAVKAFADVKASFRDIDLPQFTPFSGQYAGYTIERGTLTLEVTYKLQNRQLAADYKILIDQFDFGDKVESKDATKLPVKLAVSLLKDPDGVIDLDLPVEGSLDDPKFKIGKILVQVIGNLIAKAATAPFALLGKLFGGKGEDFSWVDFAEGHDNLDDAGKKKLDAIANALNKRPSLKLEATGRFSGDKDAEALQHLRLERKVKAQKLADLTKKGEAPASVDDVVVEESEYEAYLTKAYKKEKFKKPSGFLGIAKDLPAPEMEKLMLENLAPTNEDLRQLALARSNAVKEYLTGTGGIDAARVFIHEPGEKPADPHEKARGSRVDFNLK